MLANLAILVPQVLCNKRIPNLDRWDQNSALTNENEKDDTEGWRISYLQVFAMFFLSPIPPDFSPAASYFSISHEAFCCKLIGFNQSSPFITISYPKSLSDFLFKIHDGFKFKPQDWTSKIQTLKKNCPSYSWSIINWSSIMIHQIRCPSFIGHSLTSKP